ncbi:MAG: hypothetical protein QOJ07_1826 [Thermoleophilaceae bacterium]|nr:hypothetical protein [Thermoleophilaceae bacterium]
MGNWRLRIVLAAVVAAACIVPALALAAPPSNDAREDAAPLTVPGSTTGTTTDSTREANEPFTCGDQAGSVWYAITAPSKGDVIVNLAAQGDLDAVLDVFKRKRSQLSPVDCQQTDDKGDASIDARAAKGDQFLIRVSQRSSSVAGDFKLDVVIAQPAENPPGRSLPSKGASGRLERVTTPSDAYSLRLREGVKYRVNLAPSDSSACLPLQIFPPGTSDFESDDPVEQFSCGGYGTFTPGPGEGGRYSFVPTIGRERSAQRYHLQVARVAGDDVAPGIFVRNYQRKKGKLNGHGVDVQDLYRFDVTRRSALSLQLSTNAGFDLQLLRESGGRLACACGNDGSSGIRASLRRGRYYALVKARDGARGSYSLTRISRTITRTKAVVNGRGKTTVRPGRSVQLGVRVTSGAGGPAQLLLERFDPVDGWTFIRRFKVQVRGGSGSASFRPPSIGSYRVRAIYEGSRSAAQSKSGFARFRVDVPLAQRR